MILFADWGCPFAHRVLALLDHLQCQVELRECTLGAKHEAVQRYTHSARVPVLVVEDMVITESRVMLEYLAERHELPDAYPAVLTGRTRHRVAMAVTDDFLAPYLFGPGNAAVDALRLADAVQMLADATAGVQARPQLLAFHLAPIWLRFRIWHPSHTITRAIEAHDALCSWLDAALQLESVARTSPDPVLHQRELSRVRQLGLLPSL